ncbi:LysM peptidoglycan-binding domain-containing protein [candidate division KSB1 bacterium]|nr:LysM peptidoglycan-binding domain-containing protein [candidate division KSB1 bacterium]
MRINDDKYLSYFKIKWSVVIFLSGFLFGCLVTLLFIHISWDELIGDLRPPAQVTLDPFEKFKAPVNDRIDEKIQFYLSPHRKKDLLARYKRAGRYLPMISAIFEEYNLPQYLIFLPIIESGFLPTSKSHAGATGLWQLMPATANEYGLQYNRWIDERRDPEKSTIVAAEFLRYLYAQFGSWELALAAYNSGNLTIKQAQEQENTSDFWELKTIPKETYNFVPSFYAILHLLAYPQQYNIHLPDLSKPLIYDSIDLDAPYSLEQIAKLAHVSPDVIKRYNPALIDKIAPNGTYTIRMPLGVKQHFLEQIEENPPERIEFIYTNYRVRKGDTLYKIARQFGTSIDAIRADNSIRNVNRLKVGQVLRVASVTIVDQSEKVIDDSFNTNSNYTVPQSIDQIRFVHTVMRDSISIQTLARYYAISVDELKSFNPLLRTDRLRKGQDVIIYKAADKVTIYTTQNGDSLWRLAHEYKTSVANLKRWNQLRSSRIRPGQSLVVKLI